MRAGIARFILLGALALPLGLATAHAQSPGSKADSLAHRMIESVGGLQTWEALPYLRFDFKLYRGRELRYAVQHLWDKKLNLYRMEMPGPADEPYVAVFYTDDFESKVYWKGSELIHKDAETLMQRFRTRFFHDRFFLIAPFLLFEPGVTRMYLADASTDEEEVLQVTIPHWEGLPSNTILYHADRATGRLVATTYAMPSGEMRTFRWQDYEEYAGEYGSLTLSTRKRADSHPFLIETDRIRLPALVDSDLFMSATPVLQRRPEGVEVEDPEQGR